MELLNNKERVNKRKGVLLNKLNNVLLTRKRVLLQCLHPTSMVRVNKRMFPLL